MTVCGKHLSNSVILDQGGHASSSFRGKFLLFLLLVTWRGQQMPLSSAGMSQRWEWFFQDARPPTACWLTSWTEPEPPLPPPGSDPLRLRPIGCLFMNKLASWHVVPMEALSIDLRLIIGNCCIFTITPNSLTMPGKTKQTNKNCHKGYIK